MALTDLNHRPLGHPFHLGTRAWKYEPSALTRLS